MSTGESASPEPVDGPAGDARDALVDAVYTAVGLGALAVNRLQLARRSAQEASQMPRRSPDGAESDPAPTDEAGAGASGDAAGPAWPGVVDLDTIDRILATLRAEVRTLDERLDGLEDHVAALVDRIRDELPVEARASLEGLRSLLARNAGDVRTLLGLDER